MVIFIKKQTKCIHSISGHITMNLVLLSLKSAHIYDCPFLFEISELHLSKKETPHVRFMTLSEFEFRLITDNPSGTCL